MFAEDLEDRLTALAIEVAERGRALGLPFVGVSPDLGSAEPIRDRDGQAFAETVFTWADPTYRYWDDHTFALRSPLIAVSRRMAEPFYVDRTGNLAAWRPSVVLEGVRLSDMAAYGLASAIVAPVHLPMGTLGAVVWGSADAALDPALVFAAHADALHALAIRFLGLNFELRRSAAATPALSRREVQCLKWLAAGKTDGEVAEIVGIALSTVRFHARNASTKLGVIGRAQTVRRAASLGYLGAV